MAKLVEEAEGGELIYLTRHGGPVAVLLSKTTYEGLKSPTAKTDFWQALQEWRTTASFDWPELTPEEVDSWRDRSPGREFSWEN